MRTSHADLRPMELRWRGHRLIVSTPLDFRGDPDRWTPAHVVVAGIANCLMTMFLALARSSQLPVIAYRVTASATEDKLSDQGGGLSSVILEPEIRVTAQDRERARQILGKAVQNCLSNESLPATIRVNPRVVAVPFALAC